MRGILENLKITIVKRTQISRLHFPVERLSKRYTVFGFFISGFGPASEIREGKAAPEYLFVFKKV